MEAKTALKNLPEKNLDVLNLLTTNQNLPEKIQMFFCQRIIF